MNNSKAELEKPKPEVSSAKYLFFNISTNFPKFSYCCSGRNKNVRIWKTVPKFDLVEIFPLKCIFLKEINTSLKNCGNFLCLISYTNEMITLELPRNRFSTVHRRHFWAICFHFSILMNFFRNFWNNWARRWNQEITYNVRINWPNHSLFVHEKIILKTFSASKNFSTFKWIKNLFKKWIFFFIFGFRRLFWTNSWKW